MNTTRSTERKGSKRLKAEQRLAVLVREALESPLEAADPTYWDKRRQALQETIRRRSKS